MLKNQWYAICESKEIKNKPVSMIRLNKRIVMYRNKRGEISCFEDICSHRSASFAKGKVVDGCIMCPFHGFRFNEDGECVRIPANGKNARVSKRFNLKKYQTCEIDGFVFMYFSNHTTESRPRYFNELLSGFHYSTKTYLWETNFSRAIENQLDVVHVPFVHEKTIGRGNKTLVNGPVVKWDDELMTFYVFNEVDYGQIPQKPSEITVDEIKDAFSLQFIMPNLWQNRISDQVRVTLAFVPIDDNTTRIYLRFYQNFMLIPGLKQIVNFTADCFNHKVINEDYHIVKDQIPKFTQLAKNEQLIQGDLPIGEYRKRYRELMEAVAEI